MPDPPGGEFNKPTFQEEQFMKAITYGAARTSRNFLMMVLAAMFAVAVAGCAGAGTKTGEYIDDSTITTKVKTAMATDKTVSAIDVHVETRNGIVRLSGFVKSGAEKDRAEELARSVSGVRGVTNALTVKSD